MQLRDYQVDTVERIYAAWGAEFQNVLAILPTAAGKTVLFGHILANHSGRSVVTAHRQELISQISMALANYGVRHQIVAPKKLIQYIIRLHVAKHRRHFYDPGAPCMLASVLSILAADKKNSVRSQHIKRHLSQCTLSVGDEFHHTLKVNSWGKAWALLPPHCKGLGVTATPERTDGRGIGRWASGIIDYMVVGPTMGELIQRGYLSPYRIFAPPTSGLDMSMVPVGRGGDYVRDKMVTAVRKSQIVGDVVGTYLQHTPGKLGVTFVPDIKTGEEMEQRYNAAGVPCRLVHAKTPDKKRNEAVAALGRGDLKNLVNVDIFGEGFDLPAIEVVSFARPTQSYGLFCQQLGRALRIMPGKTDAIILDHVNNYVKLCTLYGVPDTRVDWSLSDRERKSNGKPDGPPIRVCTACTAVYESYVRDCPYCGYKYRVEAARDIEQVEGDLTEMDPSVLAVLRGEIERINAPESDVRARMERCAGGLAAAGAAKKHRERREAQVILRNNIALWAGEHKAVGREDREIYRRFFHRFGVDIMTAQTLGRPGAERLSAEIEGRPAGG